MGQDVRLTAGPLYLRYLLTRYLLARYLLARYLLTRYLLTRYLLKSRLDRPQILSGRLCKEMFLSLPGTESQLAQLMVI
jgi:hypothetical protein